MPARPHASPAERVIAQVELSAESVRYDASLVEYYTVYKLKRMDHEAVQLYLLCFVRDRYQRLNDNLLGAFCSLVRRYVEQVTVATKETIYRSRLQTGEDIDQCRFLTGWANNPTKKPMIYRNSFLYQYFTLLFLTR